MTKTLREKIGIIFEEFYKGYEGGYPLEENVNKTIQELRKEVLKLDDYKNPDYSTALLDVLALIGEKK